MCIWLYIPSFFIAFNHVIMGPGCFHSINVIHWIPLVLNIRKKLLMLMSITSTLVEARLGHGFGISTAVSGIIVKGHPVVLELHYIVIYHGIGTKVFWLCHQCCVGGWASQEDGLSLCTDSESSWSEGHGSYGGGTCGLKKGNPEIRSLLSPNCALQTPPNHPGMPSTTSTYHGLPIASLLSPLPHCHIDLTFLCWSTGVWIKSHVTQFLHSPPLPAHAIHNVNSMHITMP